MIFALPFSDFEQNCFCLLAEKLLHSRQFCTQVYVTRVRRKQLFSNYSTLYIDVRLWPDFFYLVENFKLYFTLWAKVFRVYGKKFSARLSEQHSLCPVEHSMKKSFLQNLVFLQEEVQWNFLEIQRKNF